MAMRYIDGHELKSLIRQNGALSAQQTYVIGLQIASALDAAHRNGLIHRDVKPGNILVEPGPDPDSEPIAYLADLGLTKQVDSQSGVTGSGELLGTIDYIAPEQISGSQVDGRADIYSLACVLFECLTGTLPYVRENQAAVLWAHLHDEVPRATAANPSLTAAVDAALARGMAKSPDDRFPTGRELVAALVAPPDATTHVGRDGSETRAMPSPPPAAPAGGRRGGKRALALAAALGIVLGAAGAAGVAVIALDDEPDAPQTTPEEPAAEAPTSETTETPRLAAMSPFDTALLQHVPDEFRATCRHASPLTDDFDATLSCRPGGVVDSLTYSHALSGALMYDEFVSSVARAGLPATKPPTLTGLCSAGVIPSVNQTIPVGLSGKTEVPEPVTRDERLGLILCQRREGQARLDWITNELGVYAVATGDRLGTSTTGGAATPARCRESRPF